MRTAWFLFKYTMIHNILKMLWVSYSTITLFLKKMDAVFFDSECCIYDKRSDNAPPLARSCKKANSYIDSLGPYFQRYEHMFLHEPLMKSSQFHIILKMVLKEPLKMMN